MVGPCRVKKHAMSRLSGVPSILMPSCYLQGTTDHRYGTMSPYYGFVSITAQFGEFVLMCE